MIIPQKAGQNPRIVSWSRNLSAKSSKPTLIMISNSPRVRRMTGSAISSIIGLIRPLMRPITAPAINKSVIDPEKMNPGMYLAAIRIAAQLAKIRSNSFIISINKTYSSLSQWLDLVNSAIYDFLIIISFNLKTLLPETFIFSFFLPSPPATLFP